ncbi:hypothetical protein E1B28_012734 [Marasmius oreades]|uniref:CRIM domain-containing protein n=1 Tax=Marasmius oreades TaxID=181124 RepID=A0A9P7RTG5_9AGAR|nr:uncharacterized protein E1B28_012734 [Marasmius oreades]KAG7088768.1 hypothetical protein E1B28_012734 [Marasmius oreades]
MTFPRPANAVPYRPDSAPNSPSLLSILALPASKTMFALGKKRHHSQGHIPDGRGSPLVRYGYSCISGLESNERCWLSNRYKPSDPAFSPIPSSLMSSACDEDFNFSFMSYDSEVGTSRSKPPPPAPSASSSYYLSPLRKAMKMSGVLEQPLSEVESDDDVAYSVLDFTRRDVRPLSTDSSPSQSSEMSGLTKLLNAPAPPITNPYSENVRLTMLKSSQGDDRLKITVFFPHAESPAGKSMVLDLHEEASIEELIGMGLWTYWENGWIPQLSINHTDSYTPKHSRKSVASGWKVFPVRYGFVDQGHGAYGSSDKVRLLDGVVEFAVMKASEDDYRRVKSPLGHRKSYSMPSHRMSLLLVRSRKRDNPLSSLKSVLIRTESGGSPDVVEAPV